MSTSRQNQRKQSTSLTPRRATRIQRSSNSSNTSSCSSLFSSSTSTEAVKKSFADYSPESEVLSLTDETDLDEDLEDDEEEDQWQGRGPEELDEEWDFEPKPGDAVWVKSKDTERDIWYLGHVQKSTRVGTVRGGKQGTFYSVRYHRNLRRYFAPLLGDIKPDTPRVRKLLQQAGCDLEL